MSAARTNAEKSDGAVLALNCGSSSLKYAQFVGDDAAVRGEIDRIGRSNAGDARAVPDHGAAVHAVFEELGKTKAPAPVAVGHRLVHGGPRYTEPAPVTKEVLAALREATPFAPLHLPAELRAIEAATERFGDLPQVVCFDTSFHRTMPEVARRFPLPSSFFDEGVRRYGFHGLSYEYVVESLGEEKLGRAVLAHLGNGASMAAVRDGASVDTTMGFTPTGGLVMGTRTGDLDPGLLVYLLEHRGYDAKKLAQLVDREAGLLALSGTTADMQTLLARRAHDERAALAVDVFCHHARKWIGALAAVLGGLDTLVFTGGIGEHAAAVRAEIAGPLEHLGIVMDKTRNDMGEAVVSAPSARCTVRMMRTDEERMIARHTRRALARP
jgi:acetate kinase